MSNIDHWYLHVDLDAFFASVEQLDHPEYRGKPVIVGGKPEDRRSVVSTASYEARKFGVHSAMPTFQAYKLCPQGIYVHGRMERYAELSYQIMNIFRNYSPDVDQMSIDEAFIDITGTEKLFGPPEQTAKKIKDEVKEKTGLTVSVGIAPTKYLAKIASGFNKPDGMTLVNQGEEEAFMLALPLNKVWGLGPKSLELLHSKGIKTTRDIYDMPIETLEFMFGNNMGNYLYQVVRGNEKATFSREAKNHSISSESTYPYDLTDLYTIETELLELAHGVFFRLLKENSYSRTAFVKIRYEDFSTSTVQETLERNIITLDTFFETVKRLFEKRYERGRGIRLLGVGFENVETEERPYQQDLFDNKDEKKQAVEKAILNLEKKHPEIKVRKARTFKSLLIFFLAALFFKPTPLKAEELPEVSEEEKLFEYDITGFYDAQLTAGVTSTFGNFHSFETAFSTPVFKQEVDITASVLFDNHWYFITEFADKFERNTFTVGYKNGNYIKDAKISNRNLLFPSYYSASFFGISPKGGNNQAPGLSINLEAPSKKWVADFLLRYDMTRLRSATFYGLNKVSDLYISPADFVYGLSFSFPETASEELSQIKDIYIESSYGKYTDSSGKRYKKLSLTEYEYHALKNKLLISPQAGGNRTNGIIPTILVTFYNSQSTDKIIFKTGTYDTPESFAGQLQAAAGNHFNLAAFTYPLEAEIENSKALVIQNSTGFSPYLDKNIYESNSFSNGDMFVIYKESELIDYNYNVSSWEEVYTSTHEDLLSIPHNYIQVTHSKTNNTFPFMEAAPEYYLNLNTNQDFSILLRKYEAVKELSIGTKASGGSLQVYKNNVLEPGAIYNNETGVITLPGYISQTDKIYVIWQEEDNNYTSGYLTTAAGYKYNFSENMNGDIAFTSTWPITAFINQNELPTLETLQSSYGALTAGFQYKTSTLELSDKINVSVTKENASDTLLVASQEKDQTSTQYLNYNDGYKTQVNPSLNSEFIPIQLIQKDNCTTGNHWGQTDSGISGYCIPLSWDFSKSNSPWAAVDIKLNSGEKLKNASSFEIAIKALLPTEDFSDYDFYLQLGIKASDAFTGENKELIPTWKISLENTDKWQTAKIYLDQLERSRLASYHDCRIIVIPKQGKTNISQGTVFIGHYDIHQEAIFTKASDKVFTTSSLSTYNSDFYTSLINWKVDTNNLPDSTESNIYAYTNFSSADYSNYKLISLDFIPYDITSFTLNLKNSDYNALQLNLKDITPYIKNKYSINTLYVNTKSHTVSINTNILNKSDYELYITPGIIPSTEEIILPVASDGSFAIGNLCYSENDFHAGAKNYFSIDYKQDFDNISVTGGLQSIQASGDFSNPDFIISSTANGALSSKYASASTQVSLNNTSLTNASHTVKTEAPLFSALSISEEYRYSKEDKNLSKSNNISLNLNKFKLPLVLNYTAFAQNLSISQNQKADIKGSSKIALDNYSFGIDLSYSAAQKLNKQQDFYDFSTGNYFTGWYNISAFQFSPGLTDASSRSTSYTGNLYAELPYAQLKPSLTYIASSTYQNKADMNFSDKEQLALSIPFTVSTNNFTFNITRNSNGLSKAANINSYASDSDMLWSLQQNRKYLYTAIPFYELFVSSENIQLKDNYSAKYEGIYKRKLFNSIKDVYIPSSASFTVIRDIKAQDNIKDLYQYKAVITNTSINNFGKDSTLGLFKWFKQEELLSSITGIVKVPVDLPENTSFQINASLQSLFIISDTANLTALLDGSLDTNLDWNLNSSFIYSRPSNVSFLLDFAKWLLPALNDISFDLTRKDIFNFKLNSKESKNRQTYTYQHNVAHKFLTHYSVTSGIGGSFNYIQDLYNTLELNVTLGIRGEF